MRYLRPILNFTAWCKIEHPDERIDLLWMKDYRQYVNETNAHNDIVRQERDLRKQYRENGGK